VNNQVVECSKKKKKAGNKITNRHIQVSTIIYSISTVDYRFNSRDQPNLMSSFGLEDRKTLDASLIKPELAAKSKTSIDENPKREN
jgi:hypothetical protein